MIVKIGNHVELTINTKNQTLQTIGHDQNFNPVLYFTSEEREQALADLTDYFNEFGKVLQTGIQFTEAEYKKFGQQFTDRAKVRAEETLDRVVCHGENFFTYLPKQNRN